MNYNHSDSMNIFAEIGESTSVTLCRTLCDKTLKTDLSAEFSLPDYLPEMRRLVRITVTPTAPSKFVSGNAVQLGGGVDYGICYVGADGKLYGTDFSGDYSFNTTFDPDSEYDVGYGVSAEASVSVDSVVGRVMGARKLSIKSRISASVVALGGESEKLCEWSGAPVHSHTRRLMKKAECYKRFVGSNDEIVIRDRIDTSSAGGRYVSADCGVFIEEVKGGDGYIDCRGTVKVRYLLFRESDGTPFVIEKRHPLSETVELDGMRDGSLCTAFGVCTGIDAATDGMSDGETECTVRLRILAQGFVEDSVSYVSDAYSTLYEAECATKATALPTVSCCGLKNMTFDATLPIDKLNSSAVSGVNPIFVTANASVGEWEMPDDGGRASVKGSVCFNILYSAQAEDGGVEISSAEIELPFKVEGFEASGVGAPTFCWASAFDPVIKIGSGEMSLGCEIAVSCAAVAKNEIVYVSDVNLMDEMTDKRSGISICFPCNEDSLWTVAKKYRVDPDRVRQENRIPFDHADDDLKSLESVRYLIV